MKRKKKQYGPKRSLRSAGFLVPRKFSDEDEDERLEETGQGDDKNDVGKQ